MVSDLQYGTDLKHNTISVKPVVQHRHRTQHSVVSDPEYATDLKHKAVCVKSIVQHRPRTQYSMVSDPEYGTDLKHNKNPLYSTDLDMAHI